MASADPISAVPKTSLLWAYQLRQEHIHLVKRIDDVGARLSSTMERATASEQRVADLQTQIRALEADNHALHARIAALSTEFTSAVENLSSQLTTKTTTTISSDASSNSVMQELRTQYEIMAKSMQEGVEAAAALQERVRALEEKCEQLAQQPLQAMPCSSGTTAPEDNNAGGVAAVDLDNQNGIQVQTTTNYPMATAPPPTQAQGSLLQTLKQDTMTLAAYYEHAVQLRSRMPRRKQEGHIVEAFVDGVSDASIKKSMEWYLDETAWIWSNLEQFCVQFFEAGNMIPNKRSTRSRRSTQRRS
ncbi:hypothetical protein VTN49DRAFT_4910 [Thermomyces lanuginosus]|uniref:uncharacterized protein n=1 Tax=Thermomyces lanuginosus TaxID=5541 RepID=UPI00374476A3